MTDGAVGRGNAITHRLFNPDDQIHREIYAALHYGDLAPGQKEVLERLHAVSLLVRDGIGAHSPEADLWQFGDKTTGDYTKRWTPETMLMLTNAYQSGGGDLALKAIVRRSFPAPPTSVTPGAIIKHDQPYPDVQEPAESARLQDAFAAITSRITPNMSVLDAAVQTQMAVNLQTGLQAADRMLETFAQSFGDLLGRIQTELMGQKITAGVHPKITARAQAVQHLGAGVSFDGSPPTIHIYQHGVGVIGGPGPGVVAASSTFVSSEVSVSGGITFTFED